MDPLPLIKKALETYQHRLNYGREYMKRYYDANKELVKEKNRERYRRKQEALPVISDEGQKPKRGRPRGSYKA